MSDTESFTSDNDLIDDNNYSFETDSENSVDHSIEILDSDSDIIDNQLVNEIAEDITDRAEPEANGSNDISQELIRLQSEHNYDSKPETKPSVSDPPCLLHSRRQWRQLLHHMYRNVDKLVVTINWCL